METRPKRLSLRGIVNFDQLEDILTSMLDKINTQDEIISRLQSISNTYVQKSAFTERCADIYDFISKANSKIDILQASSMSIIGNQQIPAGELAGLNYLQVQKITSSLTDFAKKIDFDSQIKSIKLDHKRDIDKLYSWSSPLDFANKLHQNQIDTSRRISSMESLLAGKVDRCDFNEIDSLVSSLRRYDLVISKVDSTISSFRTELDEGKIVTRQHKDKLNDQYQILKALSFDAKSFALKADVNAINNSLSDCTNMLQLFTSQKNFSELELKVDECRNALQMLNRYNIARDELAAKFKTELEQKATITDVKRCVFRTHYEEAVSALGSAMDTKANMNDVIQIDRRVEDLQTVIEAEVQKTTVMMRFMEWFTDRGVSYEHNMQVLDKHIENLAKASHPSARKPFVGQIRYTPAPDVMQEEDPQHQTQKGESYGV